MPRSISPKPRSLTPNQKSSPSTFPNYIPQLTYIDQEFKDDGSHRQVYTVSFHPFLKNRYVFATAGNNRIDIFEAYKVQGAESTNCADPSEISNNPITLLQTFLDPNGDEDYYSSAWTIVNNHSLLAVGGKVGIIRIISIKNQGHYKVFRGHGEAINELKFHPIYLSLLLSASKDNSVRLWNIKTDCCVAVFGGINGHFSEVVTIDFDSKGDKFVSGGMDNQILFWDLLAVTEIIETENKNEDSNNQQELKTTCSSVVNMVTSTPFDRVSLFQSAKYFTALHSGLDQKIKKSFTNDPTMKSSPLLVPMPICSTSEVHDNYVDSIKFYGDLIISKSCEDQIIIWKLCYVDMKCKPLVLKVISLPKSHIWFIKLNISHDMALLSCGNLIGQVYIWKLLESDSKQDRALDNTIIGRDERKQIMEQINKVQMNSTSKEEKELIKNHFSSQKSPVIENGKIRLRRVVLSNRMYPKDISHGNEVRQVCFSPDDKILIAVQDNSLISRWDKM